MSIDYDYPLLRPDVVEAGQNSLLDPDTSPEPQDYQTMEAGPVPVRLTRLGARQAAFLSRVIEDPWQFGFYIKGDDERASTKLRVAARYLLDKSYAAHNNDYRAWLATNDQATPGYNTTYEMVIVSRYYREALRAGMKPLPPDADLSVEFELQIARHTTYMNEDQRTPWQDIANRYAKDLYGPVVDLLLQRANSISDEQATWEERHGLLINDFDPQYLSELTLPSLDRARLIAKDGEPTTPENLAVALGLPRIIAAVAISQLVRIGAFTRSTNGAQLRPNELIMPYDNNPALIRLLANAIAYVTLRNRPYINRAQQ